MSVPVGGDDDRVAALDGLAVGKVGEEEVEEEGVEEVVVVEEEVKAGGLEPPEEKHGGCDCQRRCYILRVYRGQYCRESIRRLSNMR